MDRREIKRAIDSVQPNPGMELRIRHAVLQQKGKGNQPRQRFLQGSIVAAACCVLAAIVIMTTSLFNGSFSGIGLYWDAGNNKNINGQGPGAAIGAQDTQEEIRVEVSLEQPSSSSGQPVRFRATAIGTSYVSVQIEQGTLERAEGVTHKIEDADRIESGDLLSWAPALKGSDKATAKITASNGEHVQGSSKYLIVSRDRQTGKLTTTISDREDG